MQFKVEICFAIYRITKTLLFIPFELPQSYTSRAEDYVYMTACRII